jgi:hypothetical protein
MLKYTLVILYIFLAILLGCSGKKDIKPDNSLIDSVKQDTKSILENISVEYNGFDYEKIKEEQFSKLPNGFSVINYKYFVIFSDLDEELTYQIISNDVNNTIEAMKKNYVHTLPDNITPIILFKDYERYKEYVIANYDIPEQDISPYGFYKISKNVIVIRYINWKGSIMHEVTHRFLRSDFPDVPSWFDEGFASLHEKSTYKEGQLSGDFSWRIISIRRYLDEDKYTGLKTLMETNDDELYGPKSSFYYAQARYLLMYLQSKGRLKDYYKTFKDTYEKDKTGISQLEKILKKPLDEIDDDYLDYVKSF